MALLANQPDWKLLRTAYGLPEDTRGEELTLGDAYAAQLKLYAKTQYGFYIGFQSLVIALAAAIAVSLIVVIIRIVQGVQGFDANAIVLALGDLVVGSAAGFLQKQANEGKKRYIASINLLKDAKKI